MVYGVLKLLNFAHGDLYMVGAFIGYFVDPVVRRRARRSRSRLPLLLILMFAAACVGVRRLSASRSSASPTGRCATRRGSRR